MKVKIEKSKLSGTITAPPSKSITHRLLICGGLSEGESVIHGVSLSEDILATLDCLKAIGAEYKIEDGTVTISGVGLNSSKNEFVLNCRESGSTLRFFIPICSVLNRPSTFMGSERLL